MVSSTISTPSSCSCSLTTGFSSSHLLVGSISDVIKHSNHLALKRLQTISMRKYENFNMYIIRFFYCLDNLHS